MHPHETGAIVPVSCNMIAILSFDFFEEKQDFIRQPDRFGLSGFFMMFTAKVFRLVCTISRESDDSGLGRYHHLLCSPFTDRRWHRALVPIVGKQQSRQYAPKVAQALKNSNIARLSTLADKHQDSHLAMVVSSGPQRIRGSPGQHRHFRGR